MKMALPKSQVELILHVCKTQVFGQYFKKIRIPHFGEMGSVSSFGLFCSHELQSSSQAARCLATGLAV